MTLTTHSIIAAAVTKPLMRFLAASAIPAHVHPIFIFLVAVASHYAADAIPHWDYPLASIENPENKENRRWGRDRSTLLKDISHFALDGFLGAAIVLVIIHPVTAQQWTWALLAIIGGCLPDFLQGVYMLERKFLRLHQRFHDICHTDIRLGHYPRFGIPFQAIIAMIALYTLLYTHSGI